MIQIQGLQRFYQYWKKYQKELPCVVDSILLLFCSQAWTGKLVLEKLVTWNSIAALLHAIKLVSFVIHL